MSVLRKLPLEPVGQHVIADLTRISAEALGNGALIMRVLKEALSQQGFHCLKSIEHYFVKGGGGWTALIILAESHAAVHTYPERGYLALDIFACGSIDPTCVVDALVTKLGAEAVDVRKLSRAPQKKA